MNWRRINEAVIAAVLCVIGYFSEQALTALERHDNQLAAIEVRLSDIERRLGNLDEALHMLDPPTPVYRR